MPSHTEKEGGKGALGGGSDWKGNLERSVMFSDTEAINTGF